MDATPPAEKKRMEWGGKRPGAGRKQGSKDKAQRFIAANMASEYTEQVGFRCSPEQRRKLETVAAKRGVSEAEILRECIDRLSS